MALSQTALQGVLASATTATFLECLTITHSDIETLRFVNDTKDLNRSVGAFTRFPFVTRTPAQTVERPPIISITGSAVDQEMIFALRQIVGKRERAVLTYEVVLAQSPNTIEYGPVSFQLDSVSTDGLTRVVLTASFLRGALDDAFPSQQFAPSNSGA